MSETSQKAPYRHGDLREVLITAGHRPVEEKGLIGFTLRECARRSEVSHAAPARHFKSAVYASNFTLVLRRSSSTK